MAPWVQELHFPHVHANIPIALDDISSVLPAGPIPVTDGDCLYLSNLDDMIGSRVFTPTIYFFPRNISRQEPAGKLIREALAKVLVPYYPFSGRLREAENGKLEVFFGPDQGALVMVAHTEMTIADLGSLSVPNPAWAPLIYCFPEEEAYKVVGMPLVIAQVTNFSCGGFCLGLRLCHCLCDGLGAMQFVSAWAEVARSGSAAGINPKPCWDREFFRPRNPPTISFPHNEFAGIEDGSSLSSALSRSQLVQKCFRISRKFQAWLKQVAQLNGEFDCTCFDALAAHVWRCWVKALHVHPPEEVLRLTFAVNARQKMINPPLKEGFYGNTVAVACTTSSEAHLTNMHLGAIVQGVKAARMGVTEEYIRSTVDFIDVQRPRRLEFAGKLTITQWTRFSMYKTADFGWGHPAYAGPIDLTPTPQVCVLLPDSDELSDGSDEFSGGSIIVCICLPKDAVEEFKECLGAEQGQDGEVREALHGALNNHL